MINLKKDELRVYYNCGEIREVLDDEISKAVGKFGYTRWASGINTETRVRDLAFDKTEDE